MSCRETDEFDCAVLVGVVGESVQVLMDLVSQIWPLRGHGGFPQSSLGVTQQRTDREPLGGRV